MSQTNQKNWWGRNWKWFVPVGCLSMILVMGGLVVMLMSFAMGIMKSSPTYEEALSKAKSDQRVLASLGEPIKEGKIVSGSVNESGSKGDAELAIPISGPKGSATIYVESKKSLGQWSILKLVVEFDSSKNRIDLLETQPDQPNQSPNRTQPQAAGPVTSDR